MPVIINGTTGVTFPNGVTMSDGTSAPVTIAQGGTGANTAGAAPFAVKGANTDITALSGLSGGSASTPAISPTGDTNTGIFFPAADTIAFAEGGAEVARLDSAGNLLVGATSSYAGKTQSWGAVTANAATPNFTAIDTTAVASGVGGELAFIGQFQSNDYAYLGSMRGIKENGTSGNTACALTFFTRPTATAPQERLRIASNGAIGIGGANYGTSGQVLTSGGSGAAPSWTTISSTPTTDQVLSATAGASAGAVGTYAFAGQWSDAFTDISFGGTRAGSNLRATDSTIRASGATLSGTWRCMGNSPAATHSTSCPTVWLRIS